MRKSKIIKKLMDLLFLTCLGFFLGTHIVGCVGVIKDANSLKTFANTDDFVGIFEYGGIEEARAIADTKIDVYFPELKSGDSSELAYVVKYSGGVLPHTVAADSLTLVRWRTSEGEEKSSFKVTLPNLASGVEYSLSVEVKNIVRGIESHSGVVKKIKTFSNPTAQFMGVRSVSNVAGVNGKFAIDVSWLGAEVRGGLVFKNDIDPVSYTVSVVDGSTSGFAKNASALWDYNVSAPSRRVYNFSSNTNQVIIDGLDPATKYYVSVRAKHYGATLIPNSTDLNYKLEENTNYHEIVTYDDSTPLKILAPNSFSAHYPPGADGLISVNFVWAMAFGIFTHYRIYYSKTVGSPNIISNCHVSNCHSIGSGKTDYKLVGLDPNQDYYFTLVACVDAACTTNMSYKQIKHTTTPPVLTNYTGIVDIEMSRSIDELDKFFLILSLPDFSMGFIAGVDIFGCHSSSNVDCVPVDVGDPSASSANLISNYGWDYISDSEFMVQPIDPSSVFSYCYYAAPYVYDDMGTKEYVEAPNSKIHCAIPEIKPPNFLGFNNDANCDTLSWNLPNHGVFDAFEIYYRHKASMAEVALPLNENSSDYQRVIVESYVDSYSLDNLPLAADKMYDFGVRALFRSALGTDYWIRSNNVSSDRVLRCPMN